MKSNHPRVRARNAVRVQTKTSVLLKTAVLIAGAAGLAAAATALTLRSQPLLLVRVVHPPKSGMYEVGTREVGVIGVQFAAKQDVTVQGITVTFISDSDGELKRTVANDRRPADLLKSCELRDDAGNKLGNTAVTATTSRQTQFKFQLNLSARSSKIFRVFCDLAASPLSDGNPDIFALTVESVNDIVVVDQKNSRISQGKVSLGGGLMRSTATATSPVSFGSSGKLNQNGRTIAITVKNPASSGNAGSVTARQDGSTPTSTIILGSSQGVPTSVFKFQATGEPMVIKDLTLSNCVGFLENTNTNCTDVGETNGTDAVASVVKIAYKNAAGSTVTKTGILSNRTVRFSGLDFYVPTTESRTLTVTVDTNAVGANGAASGSFLQLNLVNNNFQAVGANSGGTTSSFGSQAGVKASRMVLRKTKPTLGLASGSPSGAGVPGHGEVLRFTVSADSRGFVKLNQIAFKLNATDNNGETAGADWNECDTDLSTVLDENSKWDLYNTADLSTKLDDHAADWLFLKSTGASCDATNDADLAYAILRFAGGGSTTPEEIGAGQSKTYTLRIDTSGASGVNDDSVRIDLPDQIEMSRLSTAYRTISWDDDTAASDIDGTYVKNLPVIGGTTVY